MSFLIVPNRSQYRSIDMKFDLRFIFLLFILSIDTRLYADEFHDGTSSNSDGTLKRFRQKASSKYRNLKEKYSNHPDRYQTPMVISDTSQSRLSNQPSNNNLTPTPMEALYSTSSIAEDYCRDFGPSSSVLLFAYRGSCYSLTNQLVTWPQADQICRNHFQSSSNKIVQRNQAGLALFDDQMEFFYVKQMIGSFNRSASEFGAYIGFSYQNQSWQWLNGNRVNFSETPPSVIAANNLIFPYQQQKPCGKFELLRPNESTVLFGLMQQECTKTERALCEIKIDHCFENNICGIHGVCSNDGNTFHCECAFLYDGQYCDQYSSEAMQVIGASLFVTVACISIFVCKRIQTYRTNRRRRHMQRRNEHSDDFGEMRSKSSSIFDCFRTKYPHLDSSKSSIECKKSSSAPPLPNPRPPSNKVSKRHRPKPILDSLLTFIQSFLTVTVAGISIVYICVQRTSSIYTSTNEKLTKDFSLKKNYICQWIGNSNSDQNIIMLPLSVVLTVFLIILHQTKRDERKRSCWANFSFPIIVNPFQKSNRFYTLIVFAIISNQLISLLYEILFSSSVSFQHGILFDLIRRLGLIILYGTRYFPILLSLNIQTFFSTFLTSIFLSFDLFLSVYFEANCVRSLTSFIPFQTRTQLEIARIHYLLFKCLPHYVALGHLIARFYTLSLRNFLLICKGKNDRWNSSNHHSMYHTTSIEYDNDWYYTKNLLVNPKKRSHSGYYLYTEAIQHDGNCSFAQKILHTIYKPKAYFRFSLLVLFTYTVSFLVLYYLTCLVIFSSTFSLRVLMTVTGNVIVKLINMAHFNLSIKSLENISLEREILIATLISCFIYVIQLLLGLKKYQNDMLDHYKGNYLKRKQDSISASNVLQRSFHYSGYQVGYLAYGFVIINYVMFIVCLFFKVLFIHPLLIKILLKFLAPIFILFALKHVLVYCLTKYFFCKILKSRKATKLIVPPGKNYQADIYAERADQAIYCDSVGSSVTSSDDDFQDESDFFTLENRHAYFLFVYFNFFFDCFLGILSCILRLFKSMIALVIFMPRLDYSTFGRNLEQLDNGYTSYTSYIYIESMHSHPVLISFTQMVYMNILERRRRQHHFISNNEKQNIEQNRRKAIRFRWFLLITLMNNVSLINTRRHYQHRVFSNCFLNQKQNQRSSSISCSSNRTITVESASEEIN